MTEPPIPKALTPAPEDEQMTPRARFYMSVVTARSLALALCCIFWPGSFTSSSYKGIILAFDWLPPHVAIQTWGAYFAATAIAATVATLTARDGAARIALMLAVFGGGCWASGFIGSLIEGVSAGPTGAIIWTALALKDASMLRQPLCNPFEPLIRKVVHDTKTGR